jgi:hypothetical protein
VIVTDKPDEKRRGWRLIVASVFVLVILASGGFFAYRTNEGIRNSYAVWWVADMVIEHLKANDNAWPKGWDDLRKPYETCVLRSGRPWSFDELRDRVDVDWGADAKSRLTTDQTTRVIWLRDGTNAYWENHEPNRLIREYLTRGK